MKRGDIVRCVDPGFGMLTQGRRYTVHGNQGELVEVKNDGNLVVLYNKERFVIDETEMVKKLLKEYNLS